MELLVITFALMMTQTSPLYRSRKKIDTKQYSTELQQSAVQTNQPQMFKYVSRNVEVFCL